MSDADLLSQAAIRRLIEAWALWRDAFEWERLGTVWHDDGRMVTTSWAGPYDEFIRRSREACERGLMASHILGGSVVDIDGNRSVAQTRMTLVQRARVHDIVCDAACVGRFYDFLERRDGRWGLVLRQPIYERDRLDAVDPAATLKLDGRLLDEFPEGYRHLAYLQTHLGLKVARDLPGLHGAAVEALYASGLRWLAGEALDH